MLLCAACRDNKAARASPRTLCAGQASKRSAVTCPAPLTLCVVPRSSERALRSLTRPVPACHHSLPRGDLFVSGWQDAEGMIWRLKGVDAYALQGKVGGAWPWMV